MTRFVQLPALLLACLLAAPIPLRAQQPAQQGAAASRAGLRACRCSPDPTTVQTALELKGAGWTYVMPQPKSKQAAWGNRDGRTTWFYGYWTNLKTHSTSSLQPVKDAKGQWIGDEKGVAAWRNGGSPRTPTQVEWLCSEFGGVDPQ
jgi:hypothetical protein